MKSIVFFADQPEVRGNIKIMHSMLMENLHINEEEDQPNLWHYLFHRWNCWNMIIDPMIIIYWLKCIFKPKCYRPKTDILYYMESIDGTHRSVIQG